MSRYDYQELWQKATGSDATQEDIDRLGEWFERYDWETWNGEHFDASASDEPTGTRSLYPIYNPISFDEDSGEVDQWEIVHYTFSRSEKEELEKEIEKKEREKQGIYLK